MEVGKLGSVLFVSSHVFRLPWEGRLWFLECGSTIGYACQWSTSSHILFGDSILCLIPWRSGLFRDDVL